MASETARRLRAEMTDAERKLWSLLRRKQLQGFRFRRQIPIGPYIADFACMAQHLIVELDGGQHAERVHYDEGRTTWLAGVGYRVLRFWNGEVFTNTDGVVETIRLALLDPPHPLQGTFAKCVFAWPRSFEARFARTSG